LYEVGLAKLSGYECNFILGGLVILPSRIMRNRW
jgi:hypothetical protein